MYKTVYIVCTYQYTWTVTVKALFLVKLQALSLQLS